MRKRNLWNRLAVSGAPWLALVGFLGVASPASVGTPPTTRKDDFKETLHGVEIADPYRWLEDAQSPETRAWIEAQNAYTESVFQSMADREKLRRRIEQYLKVETLKYPTERGGRYFFETRKPDQDLGILYFRQGPRGKDQLLIDPHPLSKDHTTSVNFAEISRDGRLFAYQVREGGKDEASVRLFDVDAHRDLGEVLPAARYFGISMKPDKSGFYYGRLNPNESRLFFHEIGRDAASDKEIFGSGYGPEDVVSGHLSKDGRYLVVSVEHGAASTKTEIYVQDVAHGGPMTPIVNDVEAKFQPSVAGDHLYLLTNWKAPRYRVLDVDLKNPKREAWRERIPEGEAVISGFSPAGRWLVVNYLDKVLSRTSLFDPSGKKFRDVPYPGVGSGSLGGEWGKNEAFLSFTSFHVPSSIYRYDLARGTRTLWDREKAPIDSAKFETKQVWYPSKDGTKVPMFVVHRKGLKLDGTAPALLTGYGGFDISSTPYFDTQAAIWIENGGVYALANLRGGSELGEEWHKGGMLGNKQNVFDDFIAAGEWLVQNHYTRPARLAITGVSNGGLLVGAALTQRPDLFGAVVCGYPLLDMVRYHNFSIAKLWVPEYGSSEDPEQFKYIYAYSPYHHVKAGEKYPAVLIESGDGDTRVDPLHARKMAALLQASNGSDKPILLLYDTKAGHSGGKPIVKQIEDMTNELAFLFGQLGVAPRDR